MNVDVTDDPIRRSEYSMHWLFLGTAAVVILLSMLMSRGAGEQVFLPGTNIALPPLCGSKTMLGLNCPGCGLTRAFISISHGRLAEAWALNRAAFVVYAFVAAQIPWQWMQIWRLRSGRDSYQPNWIFSLPILLVVALVGNWCLVMAGW